MLVLRIACFVRDVGTRGPQRLLNEGDADSSQDRAKLFPCKNHGGC